MTRVKSLLCLEELGFLRSKLAWEGGSLQFADLPNASGMTLLTHGGMPRYWGEELTSEEYSYVLRVEFGADVVLDLEGVSQHVDFLVCFLPEDKTALVARFVRGDTAVARAAAFELLETFADAAPPSVRRLVSLLAEWEGDLRSRSLALQQTLTEAQRAISALESVKE